MLQNYYAARAPLNEIHSFCGALTFMREKLNINYLISFVGGNTEPFLFSLIIMVMAFLIDLTLGEPPWRPPISLHPTVLVNKFIVKVLPTFKSRNPKIEKAKGVLLVIVMISLTTIITCTLLYIMRLINLVAYVIVASYILKVTLCIKLETEMAHKAAAYIEERNLEKGRELTSFFSRREMENLNEKQMTSAIVESIAENLTDFKLSPIFYYAIFGVPGAVAFKAINILDGTVGFKDEEHINVGWFSAMTDTIANFITSRITALLIVLAAFILREDYENAWKIMLRDRRKVPSINHGWQMAAIAGALNIQLEKPGIYTIGDKEEEISYHHIYKALKIRNVTITLFILLIGIPLMFLSSLALGFQI